MSMKLVIATHNEDKLKEIQTYFESFSFNAISLNKFPQIGEIVEDGQTLLDNALIKAREVFDKTGLPTISDDTGLEVDALNGKPGVFSARYAGEECTYLDNVKKLLKNMEVDLSSTSQRLIITLLAPANKNDLYIPKFPSLGSISPKPEKHVDSVTKSAFKFKGNIS